MFAAKEGRCAVITGSSKGWGRAIAEGLARAGHNVVINGRSDDVEVVAEAIRAQGGHALAVRADACTEAGVEQLAHAAVQDFGRVDVWANAVGIQNPQPLLALELDAWEAILRVQLTSYFLGSRCAARLMVDQGRGGCIINVVGGGAYGIPGAGAHAASKGGALSATLSWADELRPHQITVNAIRGGVQSPGMDDFMRGTGRFDEHDLADPQTQRHLGFYRREEAAPLPVWLASAAARDVSGYHIGIDGDRIVVYQRSAYVVEMYQPDGWTIESLEERLHPALRTLDSRLPLTQRRSPTGQLWTVDDDEVPATPG